MKITRLKYNYLEISKNMKHLKKNNKIFVHVEHDLCAIQRLCIKSLIFHYDNKHDIILYHDEDVQDLIQETDEEDLCNIKNPNLLQGVDKKQWINYVKAKILCIMVESLWNHTSSLQNIRANCFPIRFMYYTIIMKDLMYLLNQLFLIQLILLVRLKMMGI